MDYFLYLKSPEWAQKREAAIERAGSRCQVCNSPDRLNVHHRTYERIGCEIAGDLTALCEECHQLFHDKLPSRTVHEPRHWKAGGPTKELLAYLNSRQGHDVSQK